MLCLFHFLFCDNFYVDPMHDSALNGENITPKNILILLPNLV